MKRIAILSLVAFVLGSSGCLKDQGFEDQKYGIDIAVINAVAFPQASISPVIVGITGQAADLVIDGPLLTVEGDKAPASDVHVKLDYDAAAVTAAGLIALPAGSFSLNTLDATIPAGVQAFSGLKLTIKNSIVLNPNLKYGVGFKIISADQGYQVAANSKSVVFALTIKNMYDGEYHAEGYLYHPTAGRAFEEDKDVSTTSANSVSIFLGDLGPSGYIANLTIDPVTNKVTVTVASNGAGGPYTQFDAGLPTSNPGYTALWPGSTVIGTNGNRYDPATKTFYLRYGYMGASGWRVTEEIVKRK